MKTLRNVNPAHRGRLAAGRGRSWRRSLLFLPGTASKRTITADFPQTVSLYKGSDVKILGVPVGKVDEVTPCGTKVRVKMHYDAQVQAARRRQGRRDVALDRRRPLRPAHPGLHGGAVLPDNATLGLDRTATPLELDEIFSSLNDLTVALGPRRRQQAATGGGAR